MGAGMKPTDVGTGVGIRPTQAMTGMAKAGTAVSGVQTGAPLMALQNSPLGEQNFPHNPHRSRTGVLGGVHKSGYHPSWESGYGITSSSVTEDGTFNGKFLDAEGRMNRSGYKPAETYTSAELTELQAEFDRQEKLRLAQQQQFAELAQGSGQRATAPSANRVGGGGGGQMTPLNPAAIPKRDDDILTAPFLGRWRNR